VVGCGCGRMVVEVVVEVVVEEGENEQISTVMWLMSV
jgi:hypothetical protein